MEAGVTRVMPCMRALPERVALTSLSTELGEVKMCLNACDSGSVTQTTTVGMTYRDKDWASKEATPWVFAVVFLICVDKHRPLITADCQLTTDKFLADSRTNGQVQ